MKSGFDDLARAYSASEPPKRSGEIGEFLDWIGPRNGDQALDVASGPATIARLLAPRVKRVFAVDLAHAMLSEAGRLEALPANLFLAAGDVEHLPFQEAAFDLVTCAYALANLRDLPAMLRESVRVVARSGRIAFMDVVAPEDSSQCDSLNRLEQMRSDFYTRIRPHSECLETFRNAGLALEKSEFHQGCQRMSRWLQLSPAAANRERAEELCRALLDLGDKAGLGPRSGSDGEVEFCYQTAWFLLRRESP